MFGVVDIFGVMLFKVVRKRISLYDSGLYGNSIGLGNAEKKRCLIRGKGKKRGFHSEGKHVDSPRSKEQGRF
jgi:hypothetical protein